MLEPDVDLLAIYQQCVTQLLNPPEPEYRNTDGDRLEWCRSTYTFDPA